MSDDRIPTHLWIEAEIRRLSVEGVGVYVLARGDKMGGMALQKISGLSGECRLLMQQRDMFGKLTWVDALGAEKVSEQEADAYIQRSISRDPDIWVIEITDREMKNLLKSE